MHHRKWLLSAFGMAALLLLVATSSALAADRLYRFPLPSTGTQPVQVSGNYLAWSDAAGLESMDLRTGKVVTCVPQEISGFDLDGHFIVYVVPQTDASPATARIYDLLTRTEMATPVPMPEGIDPSASVERADLSGDRLLLGIHDNVTMHERAFLAAFDTTDGSAGIPVLAGDVTPAVLDGDIALASSGAQLHAVFCDLSAGPAVFTPVALALTQTEEPDADLSGTLAVWRHGLSPEGIDGAFLDPATKTAGDPFFIASTHSREPRVSGDRVMYRGFNGDRTPLRAVHVVPGQDYQATEIAGDAEKTWLDGDVGTYFDRDSDTWKGVWFNPTRPVAKAPSRTTVTRGASAKVKYRVDDRLWKAKVTLKVTNRSGRVVLTTSKSGQPANVLGTISFRCSLAKGTYRFFVTGTNMAGLTSKTATNTLVVR